MSPKNFLAPLLIIGCGGVILGCPAQARTSRSRGSAELPNRVARFKVRIIAVAETNSKWRGHLADHAWTPDGLPYRGSERRLSGQGMESAPKGGLRRCVVFEVEQTQKAETEQTPGTFTSTPVDVFAYLPKARVANVGDSQNPGAVGPLPYQIWNGVPRVSAGNIVIREPYQVALEYGVQTTDPQPVIFGIAQGEFKKIAKGSATVAGLALNQTAILASGPWGRIEATHLPQPMEQDSPAPTHRFRLLGGVFPPKMERRVFFYDSKGHLLASCGDGPNNPGYARGMILIDRRGPEEIASFEIQERPYKFFQFDKVSFKAPHVDAYSGQDGLDHAVDSPIGKVVGVLKPIKDGPWSSDIVYAADGKRWLDPGSDLAGYEYFGSWDQLADDRLCIVFEPSSEFTASKIPTTCEIHAVDSPDGPAKERLTSWDELPFRSPTSTIPCKPTTRPYMRLEIRLGNGAWRTVETVAVTNQMLRAVETGPAGTMLIGVSFNYSGAIRTWTAGTNPALSKATWRPGEQRIRTVAHLHDGKTVDIDFNESVFSGAPPNQKPQDRGLNYFKQLGGSFLRSGVQNIEFKDIASFDLQVQNLKPAIKIPMHSPVN